MEGIFRNELEQRLIVFAKDCKQFVKSSPKTQCNYVYVKQFIRSTSSVAANYIEAQEALSKKDFYYRIKVSRKEARETRYWFELIDYHDIQKDTYQKLVQENEEIIKILSSIANKQKKNT